MKKLRKMNLHNLSQAEMAKKEMNALKGGIYCHCTCMCRCDSSCGCKYAGSQEGPNDPFYGGSSQNANGLANANQSNNGMTDRLAESVRQDTMGFYY